MITVRRAKQDDLFEFVVLVKKFANEAYKQFPVDKELTSQNFLQGIADPNFIFMVAETEGEVVGIFVGCANAPLFSTTRTAVELGFYMHPDHRDGKTALKMMNEFEKWAQSQGCKSVTMVDIHTHADLSTFYTRKGYELKEKSYMKEF